MAAFLIFQTALILSTIGAFAYPTEEMLFNEDFEPFPQTSRSCYHFYVSRNMSTLLSEATEMLQHVSNRREQEWILTFIYRIKSLAEHLRTHPNSRKYDCLEDPYLRVAQPELYFEDDLLPGKRSNDATPDSTQLEVLSKTATHTQVQPEPNFEALPTTPSTKSISNTAESTKHPAATNKPLSTTSPTVKPEVPNPETHLKDTGQSHSKYDNVIVVSSSPDCESSLECEEALSHHIAAQDSQSDDLLIQQLHTNPQDVEMDHLKERVLKLRVRKALLEEMAPEVMQLQKVGGTQEDLLNLWKQNELEQGSFLQNLDDGDFDYEEIGAAAGDLNTVNGHTASDHTVAPSPVDLQKRQKTTASYEPYDDSDVLVKQLFDMRLEKAALKPTEEHNKEHSIKSSSLSE